MDAKAFEDAVALLLELFKIGIAITAVAVASYSYLNATRVFEIQNQQLEIARGKEVIDRRADTMKVLNESPRFRAVFFGSEGSAAVYILGNDGGIAEHIDLQEVLPIDLRVKEHTERQVCVVVANSRKAVGLEHVRIKLLNERELMETMQVWPGRIEVPGGNGDVRRHPCHVIRFPRMVFSGSKELEMVIRYETDNGLEGEHDYKLLMDARGPNKNGYLAIDSKFRRTNPESLATGTFYKPQQFFD